MRKEVRKEVVLYRDVTVYVAEDGTEFKVKSECERYELEKLKKPLLEKLQKCDEVRGMANFNGEYISDLNEYEWYFIRNEEDMEILNKVFDLNLKYDDIGEWICVEVGEGSDGWCTTASQGIEYATFILTRLGYKVEITKEVE